jgi:hypothetical protein
MFPLGVGYTLTSRRLSTPIVVFAHEYTPDDEFVNRDRAADAQFRTFE